MTTCPACDKPVDPLRARFVGVRDGRVVAYCSAECLAGKPAAGAERAMSPASGVPKAIVTPAAGVPARSKTPAAGVPAKAAEKASGKPPEKAPEKPPEKTKTPAAGVPVRIPSELSGPPRPGTPAPGVPASLESGPVIEILHEPASGVVASAADVRTAPRARHPDEIAIGAFWSADKERSSATAAGDAAEAAGASDAAPDASAGRTAPADRAAPDDDRRGDAQAADKRPPTDSDFELPRPRRWPLLIVALLLLGGGAAALYYVYGRDPAGPGHAGEPRRGAASAATLAPAARVDPPRASRPPQAAAPPGPDAAAALEVAREALRRDLTATSPRVQRLAAAALARAQDRDACALLAAQIGLASERVTTAVDPVTNNDIARLDLAYALARGGDRRGGDVLAGALGAPRADARDEAARLLALLGDRRAVPHLLDVLAVTQRRLGAAEHLAHLAEPQAVKILEQLRADPRTPGDARARAIVALGVAGRGEVAGPLRAMLDDPHFNAFAAGALAALDDRAAQPVLERQLASPQLRVQAARALRRLDPAIDPRPLLPPLLDAVRTGRDIERIPAAEAILLLAGPASWSTYE
jgi:HEAT repeat protein